MAIYSPFHWGNLLKASYPNLKAFFRMEKAFCDLIEDVWDPHDRRKLAITMLRLGGVGSKERWSVFDALKHGLYAVHCLSSDAISPVIYEHARMNNHELASKLEKLCGYDFGLFLFVKYGEYWRNVLVDDPIEGAQFKVGSITPDYDYDFDDMSPAGVAGEIDEPKVIPKTACKKSPYTEEDRKADIARLSPLSLFPEDWYCAFAYELLTTVCELIEPRHPETDQVLAEINRLDLWGYDGFEYSCSDPSYRKVLSSCVRLLECKQVKLVAALQNKEAVEAPVSLSSSEKLRLVIMDSASGILLNDKVVKLPPQGDKVFKMMARKPSETIKYEKFYKELWPDIQAGSKGKHPAKGRLQTEINGIRDAFKSVIEEQLKMTYKKDWPIENVKGVGYALLIDPELATVENALADK